VTLSETLQQDMKSALRSGAKLELGALRLAIAAIRKQEIENRAPLPDAGVLSLLEKMIKQGRDAQQQFESAGRGELAAKEAAEIAIFARYLPQALTGEEIEALIAGAIESTGAGGIQDIGRVMAAIKSEAAGRVDMAAVSARVRERLTNA
jgi:hypothetical protein